MDNLEAAFVTKTPNEKLECLCLQFQEKLNREFEFLDPKNPHIPRSLVFYDENQILNRIYETKGSIRKQFYELLETGIPESTFKLNDSLQLNNIGKDLIRKNQKNRKNAEKKAKRVIRDLYSEYQNKIKENVCIIKKLDELQLFHCNEMEKIRKKFQKINLGRGNFQQEWLEKLTKNIESDFLAIKQGIEATAKRLC